MENDRFAKSVYVGEYTGSQSVGRLLNRWIDTVKDFLRKAGLDVRQARRMEQDRSEWQVCKGECMGCSPGNEPLILMKCHSYISPLGGNLSVADPKN